MSRMPILGRDGLYQVEVSAPETKSLIGRYWGDAVSHFIETGDGSRLKPYRGRSVDGVRFETDPDAIEDFYMSTDFDFQELYEP